MRKPSTCINHAGAGRYASDPLDEEETVIHANRQREKTTEVKAREFQKLKMIEAERAKRRQIELAGTRKADLPVNLPGGDARDLAAEKIGMSGRTAEKASRVIDHIDTLTADGRDEEAEAEARIDVETERYRGGKFSTTGIRRQGPRPGR